MSDANLIKDKIREELEKGMPTKRKILSYLLDLLKKDKYPSLTEIEFYDIVGNTYKLNLKYKLNLEMLFLPIYNELKKKIKKLYGKEKKLEMEQYLIKNYGLFSQEQTFKYIKEEFEQVDQSKISAFLSDLLSKKEYQLLSESEFIDTVGEAFKSNPEFYMKNLDGEVRKRVKKLYGDEKLKEMVKNIFEKYSLYDGEQILFESEGGIRQFRAGKVEPSGRIKLDTSPVSVSIKSGTIMITNYRLITQGKLKVSGGQSIFWGPVINAISGNPASRRDESRRYIMASSAQQELPCYGYQFSIQNHTGLEKMYSSLKVAFGIRYAVVKDNLVYYTQIKLPIGTSQAKVEEQVNILFKILCKDKNQVLNIIKEYLEMEFPKRKRAELLNIFRHLRTREEYQDISDSEYLDIVETTYKMNPQFFMDFLYPKMKDWGSFILDAKFKEEFIELIENLNKETE